MGRFTKTIGGTIATLVVLGACWAIAWGLLAAAPPIREPRGPWIEDGPAEAAEVWAVGDADASTASRALGRMVARQDPDRFLYLGDVYASHVAWKLLRGDGTWHDFDSGYDSALGELAPITAPTPGNHEWRRRGDGYEPYWRREHGSAPPAWYAFEIAGWEVLVLNSEAPHGEGSRQVEWLREQVADGGTCRIAMWHRPRYSAAVHRGDQAGMEPLWETVRGRAAIVLGGDDHNLQRIVRPGEPVMFVVGAGGRNHHANDEDYPGLAFSDVDHDGALRLELAPGVARHAFVTTSGRSLDSGELRCTVEE